MRTPWHSPSLHRWLRANVKGVFAPRRISPGLWRFRPCIRHFDNHLREQARKGFYLIQGKSADSDEGEAPDDRMRHGRPHRTPQDWIPVRLDLNGYATPSRKAYTLYYLRRA